MARRRAQSAADNIIPPFSLPPKKGILRGTVDCNIAGNNNSNTEPVAKWMADQGFPMPTNTVMRQASHVFQELLQTETQYVEDLKILVNVRKIKKKK